MNLVPQRTDAADQFVITTDASQAFITVAIGVATMDLVGDPRFGQW